MSDEKPVGVFLCTCKGDLGHHIDMGSLVTGLSRLPGASFIEVHEALCSSEGLEFLKDVYRKGGCDRVVVGACTPNIQGAMMRAALEAAGLNKYLYEQVNVRELCGWVHSDAAAATEKALRLMDASVARARLLEPLEDIELKVVPEALVVGGGVSGMQAALEIAGRGFQAHLVERTGVLGGRTYRMSFTFPTHDCGLCTMQACRECELTPKPEQVLKHPKIRTYLNSEMEAIGGGLGDRSVRIRTPKGPVDIHVGTVIITTGSDVYDPRRSPEYGYGRFKDVVTTMELERMLAREREFPGRFVKPSDGKTEPKTVNFVQCVGSRDGAKGNLHCSLVCCTYAIGQAREIKKLHPGTNVFVHHTDLRGPHRGFEDFYGQAMNEGVVFVRGRVAGVYDEKGQMRIKCEDTDASLVVDIPTDLVVLTVGQEPAKGSDQIAKLLHVCVDGDRFIKDLNPNHPSEYRRGVFVAGCAEGPKGIRSSIEDARMVAQAASDLMAAGKISKTRAMAVVDEGRCRGCGVCEETCEYKAAKVVEKDGRLVSVRDEALCEGCGLCAAQCCNRAITVKLFTRPQVEAQLRRFMAPAGPSGGAPGEVDE